MTLLEGDARASERSNTAYHLRIFAMETLKSNYYDSSATTHRARMVLECADFIESNFKNAVK